MHIAFVVCIGKSAAVVMAVVLTNKYSHATACVRCLAHSVMERAIFVRGQVVLGLGVWSVREERGILRVNFKKFAAVGR